MSAKQTAIVIGAGVGGMAVAAILAKAGYAVTVYEKASTPGGRMGRLELDGFTFDTGPSWYLMKDVFEHYFALFGKRPEDYYTLKKLSPAYKVFYETRPSITITDDHEKNLALFEAIEPGSASQLRQYIASGEQNYKSALKYFLYNTFTKPVTFANREVLRALPAFVPVLSSSLHGYVSKRFKTQELQQILEYPSVFLGASPFSTPALYQLMSYLDFSEGVFYPEQRGMHAVTESLYTLGSELGVTYIFDTEVTAIATENHQVKGIKIDDTVIGADIVVSNSDLHYTETKLLDESDRSYPESFWQKRQAGPSALLMYLGVKGTLPELEHHNLFFVKDWKENFAAIYDDKLWPDKASIYVSRTTATDPSTAPDGHENIFVLVPLPAGTEHKQVDIDQFVEQYLEQIEQLAGIPDLRSRIVAKEIRTPSYFGKAFHSWQNTALGMSHTLTQSAFFRPSVKSKKVRNLYYVGGGVQPGIGVPMCIISAQLVYKHIMSDSSPQAPNEIRSIL